MYVYPLTRLVIRKYAVHVRSCMITGLAAVLRVRCTLYRTCPCAPFFVIALELLLLLQTHTHTQKKGEQTSPASATKQP